MVNIYSDFYGNNTKYRMFRENKMTEEIFNLLATPENIYKMITFSEMGKPALDACIAELEHRYKDIHGIDTRDIEGMKELSQKVRNHFDGEYHYFSLDSKYNRQIIGTMVRFILEPFGYKPVKQKKVIESKFFSVAAVYSLIGVPRLEIVQKLEIRPVDPS